MISYSVFIESGIAESISDFKPADRVRVLKLFQKLRTSPFLEGDYVECDDIGRPMQVIVVGRYAVVFWADHAVKEVKILDVKPAGT